MCWYTLVRLPWGQPGPVESCAALRFVWCLCTAELMFAHGRLHRCTSFKAGKLEAWLQPPQCSHAHHCATPAQAGQLLPPAVHEVVSTSNMSQEQLRAVVTHFVTNVQRVLQNACAACVCPILMSSATMLLFGQVLGMILTELQLPRCAVSQAPSATGLYLQVAPHDWQQHRQQSFAQQACGNHSCCLMSAMECVWQ